MHKVNSTIHWKFQVGIRITSFVVTFFLIVAAFILSLSLFAYYLIILVVDKVLLLMSWSSPFFILGIIVIPLVIYGHKSLKWFLITLVCLSLSLAMVDMVKATWPEFDLLRPMGVISNESTSSQLDYRHVSYEYERNYIQSSDVLGFAPVPNNQIQLTCFLKDEILFNVQYTIDSNGLRISPPFEPHPQANSILFFGGSNAFGHGMADNETLPYQLGLKTNGQYKIYNFGFNDYGTHQMVSALDHHWVDSIVSIPPAHIFYVCVPHHLSRLKNEVPWGEHDPQYKLNSRGEAVFVGNFDDADLVYLQRVWTNIKKNSAKVYSRSYLLQRLFPKQNDYTRNHLPEEQNLFVALIKRAEEVSKEQYPRSEFHVIYFNQHSESESRFYDLLKINNIDCIKVSDIIPDYFSNKYVIKYPYELNPGAPAYHAIANYLAEKVIKIKP